MPHFPMQGCTLVPIPMPLSPGDKIGHYEILSLLGQGGMGEVYRARDTRLKRDVAIKVLPAALAHDLDRMARFEREARLLASLDHPNIGAIYGLEESNGTRSLVLAFIEGPTLADRVAAGPIPLERSDSHRAADRRGTRIRPRSRRDSSRPETRQREDHAGRRGQGSGFRPGQGAHRRKRRRIRLSRRQPDDISDACPCARRRWG